MPDEALVSFSKVTFSYTQEGAPAIFECTFFIESGDFVCLVGHNSSGKSTIAKLTNGLLTPKDGQVKVLGLFTSESENLIEIRKNVGLVFQNPDNQTVASQVEDDVAFGPENLNLPQDEIRKRVDEALDAVGMRQYATHPVHHLSGGQKQLVAIAGILALKPKLLILDEATSLLDPKGRKSLLSHIVALNKNGYAILMITHRMEEVLLSRRVLALEKGRIIFDGHPHELFINRDLLFRAGLEPPPLIEVASGLQKHGLAITLPKNEDDLVEQICQLK